MAGEAPRALRGGGLSSSLKSLSVLIPVRDGARFLPEAMESVSAQTFADFEVVVVDDGSGSEAAALLDGWAERDRRVRVLRPGPVGLAKALALALADARAPIIARMDGDDVCLPRRFELQLELLTEREDLSLVASHVELFPRGELKGGMLRYERWLNGVETHEQIVDNLFIESPVAHPTIMARREAIESVGGYVDDDGPEDYDLWLRLVRQGHRLAKVPQVLLRWRDRPLRATRTDTRYRTEAIDRLKARHLVTWRLGGAEEVYVWGAGPLGKGWSRRLARLGVSTAAFIDIDPRKIGQRLYDTTVIAPDDLPPPGTIPVLTAVGVAGAREIIRRALAERGYGGPERVIAVQ